MTKTSKNKIVSKKREISSLAKRKEMIVGAITLLIVVVLFAQSGMIKLNKNKIPAPIKETSSTFITPNPFATTKPTLGKEISEVKNLSNTSSDIYEIVRNGDSYWRIAKRVCGTGKIYMLLSEYNNSKPLFKDDLVKVSCF